MQKQVCPEMSLLDILIFVFLTDGKHIHKVIDRKKHNLSLAIIYVYTERVLCKCMPGNGFCYAGTVITGSYCNCLFLYLIQE